MSAPAPLDVDPHVVVDLRPPAPPPLQTDAAADPESGMTPGTPADRVAADGSPIEADLVRYKPLYHAALVGDWRTAETIFERDPQAITAIVNLFKQTALHVATSVGRTKFVKKLVELMPPEALEMQDCNGRTALHLAAIYGSLDTVQILVDKNGKLTQIVDGDEFTPLGDAAYFNSKEVLWYLTINTTDDPPGCPFTGPIAGQLMQVLGCAGLYGVQWITRAAWEALEYVGHGVKLIKDVKYKHKCTQRLVEIACQEIAQTMTPKEIISYFDSPPILHDAVGSGAVEIITICLQYFPSLIWIKQEYGHILHMAISLRREKVFNLMLENNVTNKLLANIVNESKQTILHLVGKVAPYPQLSSVSCPALQMQRELLWFKAVEEFIHPSIRLLKDDSNQTARELFTSEHRDLLRDAERWMKDTSNSCMLVATLIATVVFAAAFTVPGGNIEGKGIPLFLNKQVFMLFGVSDALALFSSTTSILMFLSILTARYAEEDFLRALPKRLILGFASLFLAIATMMVAFGATLYIVMSEKFTWIFIPIIGLTSIPVALFGLLQLPLFIYMIRSTYGSGIFHPKKIW